MIVGHQPTWSMLVARLTGSPIEMKTGSVAVIALEIDDWSELAGAEGELVELLEAAAYMKADS
jgi:phosphohistidine phosphatase SixA